MREPGEHVDVLQVQVSEDEYYEIIDRQAEPEEQPLPPSFRSEHEKKWATPPEDTALAMRTLWQSERKINLNGKWYVPISEVADILTTPTEEPLNEEWQAKCFPNLNIGKRNKEEQ